MSRHSDSGDVLVLPLLPATRSNLNSGSYFMTHPYVVVGVALFVSGSGFFGGGSARSRRSFGYGGRRARRRWSRQNCEFLEMKSWYLVFKTVTVLPKFSMESIATIQKIPHHRSPPSPPSPPKGAHVFAWLNAVLRSHSCVMAVTLPGWMARGGV